MGLKRSAVTTAAAVIAVLACAQPALASPAPAGDDLVFDFDQPGVQIFNGPNAAPPVNGLGYPGELFISDYSEWSDVQYDCGDGVDNIWARGYDKATGVPGWVPACNLAKVPS